ncbi:MAG: hypothetical protein ACTSX8_02745 [Alphaproteobacteria bacterium]
MTSFALAPVMLMPKPPPCAHLPINSRRYPGPRVDAVVERPLVLLPTTAPGQPMPHVNCDPLMVSILNEIFAISSKSSDVTHLVGVALETARATKYVGCTEIPPEIVARVLGPVKLAIERGVVERCTCRAATVDDSRALACLALDMGQQLSAPAPNATETIRLPLLLGRDEADLGFGARGGWVNIPYIIDMAPLLVYVSFFQRSVGFHETHARPHGVAFRADVADLRKFACEVDRDVIPIVDNCCWLWFATAAQTAAGMLELEAAATYFSERLLLPRQSRCGAISFIVACRSYKPTIDDVELPDFLDGAAACVANLDVVDNVVSSTHSLPDFVAHIRALAPTGRELRTLLPECEPTRAGSTWGRRECATPGLPALFYATAKSLHMAARRILGYPEFFDEAAHVKEGYDATKVQPFVIGCLPEDLIATAMETCGGSETAAIATLSALEAIWSAQFRFVARVGVESPPYRDADYMRTASSIGHGETFRDTRFLVDQSRVRFFSEISPSPRLGVPTIAQYTRHTTELEPALSSLSDVAGVRPS